MSTDAWIAAMDECQLKTEYQSMQTRELRSALVLLDGAINDAQAGAEFHEWYRADYEKGASIERILADLNAARASLFALDKVQPKK